MSEIKKQKVKQKIPQNHEEFQTIMQRRLLKFVIQSIGKQLKVTFKNNQVATGILHAFDTDQMNFILKNYAGNDQKKQYKKIFLSQIQYFKTNLSSQ